MLLQHIRLAGVTRYDVASRLQSELVQRLLAHKANPSAFPPPPPVVISGQFHPVYTCGRREVGTVTPGQQEYLRAEDRAEFREALRGGQTTFHGPGQLVAYPILDLKRHGLSARCYIDLLEGAVIETCLEYGIKTRRTKNPGVWVDEHRKIGAVGVHMRRNVSSHGIGLNVDTELWWFNRIVACGLADKRATSFREMGVDGKSVENIGEVFVEKLAARLKGVDGVDLLEPRDVYL